MFEHGRLAINGETVVSSDTYITRALPSHFGRGASQQLQARDLPGRRTPAATKSHTAAISADHGVLDQTHDSAVDTHIQAPREDTVKARPRGSPGYSRAALTAVATGARSRVDGCSGRGSPVTPPNGESRSRRHVNQLLRRTRATDRRSFCGGEHQTGEQVALTASAALLCE